MHLPYHNEMAVGGVLGYGAFSSPVHSPSRSPHLGANGSLSKQAPSPSPKEPLPHHQGGDFPSSPTNCIPTSNTSAAIGNFHVWPIESVVRGAI